MKYDALVKDLTEAANSIEQAFGPDSPRLINVLRPLAFTLKTRGDARLAAEVFLRLRNLNALSAQDASDDRQFAMHALQGLVGARDFPEALALYRELANEAVDSSKPDFELNMIGADCLRQTGDTQAADTLLTTLANQDEDRPGRYSVLGRLVGLKQDSGDLDAAIDYARQALSVLESLLGGTQSPALIQDIDSLVRLLKARDLEDSEIQTLVERRRSLKKAMDR